MSEVEIRHVTQPTPNTCVHACLAMVTEEGLDGLIERFGDQGLGWREEATVLVEYKLFPVQMSLQLPNPFGFRGVYLVTVASRNLPGKTHRVVAQQTGEDVLLFDPNDGRDSVEHFPRDALMSGEASWSEVTYLDPTVLLRMHNVFRTEA